MESKMRDLKDLVMLRGLHGNDLYLLPVEPGVDCIVRVAKVPVVSA
jgi:hypothetical protein